MVSGFKVEQDQDDQFAQAGCGQEVMDRFAWGHHYFMGNLHPRLIINVTGNLQYQLDHFADYSQDYAGETKTYKLQTTKVTQQN